MSKLTTHILDTVLGVPAAGVAIELYRVCGARLEHIVSVTTNSDGRTNSPLLQGEDFQGGAYELHFLVGAYFLEAGLELSKPLFLDRVPIRFSIASTDEHYHVPLLVSPWAYSTYRGS